MNKVYEQHHPKVIGYVRVSTDRQADQGVSSDARGSEWKLESVVRVLKGNLPVRVAR
jgi:hypothetical protein